MSVRINHYGPDGAHEGCREDCVHPGCEWPRPGDLVSGRCGEVERVGELTDTSSRSVIRVAGGTEYEATDLRKPDWGMYCTHGLKIIEEESAEHLCKNSDSPVAPVDCRACWPVGRKVSPWPCSESECTEEAFDKAEQEEMDARYEEEWGNLGW